MPHIPFRSRLFNLKTLIVLLAFFVAFITLINGFYATYEVQKQQLIKQTLDTNHAYAQKLAAATDNFIIAAHQQLAYSASVIAADIDNHSLLMTEAERLRTQTNSFNSIMITSKDSIVLATAPSTQNLVGQKISSTGALESLEAQSPFISKPYLSTVGNFVILISAPIFNQAGDYLGYVGGNIYLKQRSILNDLIGEHFHQDGSYNYVLDQNRQFIYHPDPNRVGAFTDGNIATNSVLNGGTGAIQSVNSLGVEMLAGYATIETAGWGIVAQRPVSATLLSLNEQMEQVVYRTLPLAFLTFVLIWLLATLISRPLRKLAHAAQKLDSPTAYHELINIPSWYFESDQLKKAMIKGLSLLNIQISQLQQDAATDPLTGAFNRRSLQLVMSELHEKKIPFSVLAVDIDHFKKVNDTFGHAVGDNALIALVQMMHKVSREKDIVARTGGEEFLLILPNTPSNIALIIAERLRTNIAEMEIEPIGSIKVSIGVSTSSESDFSSTEVIDQADQALYQAKALGRNRSEVFSPN
ncbi:sensor domain-containing diguanylate cyclase [Aliidiomarina quisquiliarum]|uniref:sensor domain-containing diguanylate cyclase n=1 Tax=Aliidiomarina quisquiliarum TaxID=2938947 RepID=UPI00208FC234|nr:sensor domain-containing diguanylate cyclase [Aliidiomarina quisquiliarum]MCO4321378.1 sensor domain-containing diguanylate cyclase [Aliidiomarina quisquiliarum]